MPPLLLYALVLISLLHPTRAAPTVILDRAKFVGKSGSANTASFLGIPFAQPPVGDLRFRLPRPIEPYATGLLKATAFGKACPQQDIDFPVFQGLPAEVVDIIVNDILSVITPDAEDCLTINVIKPQNATATSKLPVVVWIFGGGFEFGSAASNDGTKIVERSIAMDKPAIYVSFNHRVSAFGFLASKEIRAAGVGNLGLHDQREAFRWVQKYIAAFGGDPQKVTIWGGSSGAISVSLQMLTNNGDTEGLFRAAFMQSGSPIPTGPVENGQKYYDAIVAQTGCVSSKDTLQCLRGVPYPTLKKAMNASPGIFAFESLVLAWLPRADGVFLTDSPQRLVKTGQIARIPFITGDCDDEGTLFSVSAVNISTDDEYKNYIEQIWLPGASPKDLDPLYHFYPNVAAAGSPFDTGVFDALSKQFKRISAFQGDAVFQAPRRLFQKTLDGKQDQWAFLSQRMKAVPFLGSYHFSDLRNIFFDGELTDYLINFATDLHPNGPTVPLWPKWSTAAPNLMTFHDGRVRTSITQDTYRAAGMQLLTDLTFEFPI
ncbi:Alpha/Beta hydrolase protein [Roridomyces roridus]|uniref:Carboxylic ester hydrolase n=1 Tax=Roridomyces roridus TaxID=1738132 RepID=A0AAD7BNC1_9AGAR|nr:Alpha/Beta hydrolase protein [Roridomyces roridus]